jgi:5-formyltetrahydrofolate cyclo-ligase
MPHSELSTTHLVQHALAAGKTVFVPYLHPSVEADRGADGYLPKRCMDMVSLHGSEDFESLEADNWGIPSVSPQSVENGERERVLGKDSTEAHGREIHGLDLMILPGVVFQVAHDKHGKEVRRLGHGKGFYDFFLRRYAQRYGRLPTLVGVGLREQVLEEGQGEVPVGETDVLLDGVIDGEGRCLGLEEEGEVDVE